MADASAAAPKRSREAIYDIVPPDARAAYDVRGRNRMSHRRLGVRGIQGTLRQRRSSAASHASTGTRSAFSRTTASSSRESALKGAHFIELCARRNTPLVFLQKRHGLHDRQGLRAPRHRKGRREARHGRGERERAEIHRRDRRQLRRRQLRHVRARVFPPNQLVDVAQRPHLRDGRRTSRGNPAHRAGRGGTRRAATTLDAEAQAAFKAPILAKYVTEGQPVLRDGAALGRRHHRPGPTRATRSRSASRRRVMHRCNRRRSASSACKAAASFSLISLR